jgi:hypothetical protein
MITKMPPHGVMTWAVALAKPVIEEDVARAYTVIPFAYCVWKLKLKNSQTKIYQIF